MPVYKTNIGTIYVDTDGNLIIQIVRDFMHITNGGWHGGSLAGQEHTGTDGLVSTVSRAHDRAVRRPTPKLDDHVLVFFDPAPKRN